MTVNTIGSGWASGRSSAWLWPLLPIALATFALSALVSFHVRADSAGEPRSLLQAGIVDIYLGVGFVPAFLFFLLVLAWSSIWFLTGRIDRPGIRLLRLLGLTLSLAIWVNLRAEPATAPAHAGAIGAWIGGRMVSALGYVLSTLIVAPITLASLLLATDYFFYRYFEALGASPAPEQPPQGGGVVDAGVEVEVTEQFKALSNEIASPRTAATARRRGDEQDRSDRAGSVPDEPGRDDEPAHTDAAAADGGAAAPVDGEAGELAAGRVAEFAAPAADDDDLEDEFSIAAALPDLVPDRAASEPDEAAGTGAASDDPGDDADEVAADDTTADTADDDRQATAGGRMSGEPTTDGVAGESVVQIPRPSEGGRQQRLFASRSDEDLIQEAIELVTSTRRVSATFLQRQLRIDFAQAMEVLGTLASRGVIEHNEGETSGRVR
jgi:hypothetical protein